MFFNCINTYNKKIKLSLWYHLKCPKTEILSHHYCRFTYSLCSLQVRGWTGYVRKTEAAWKDKKDTQGEVDRRIPKQCYRFGAVCTFCHSFSHCRAIPALADHRRLLRRITDDEHMSSSLSLRDAALTALPPLSVSLPAAFPWENTSLANCIDSTRNTERSHGGCPAPPACSLPASLQSRCQTSSLAPQCF